MERLGQAVPAALYFYNIAAGTDTFLNDHLSQALGHSLAALAQLKPWALEALLHPYDKASLQPHLARLRQGAVGTSEQLEVRLRDADNNWHWFKVQHTVFMCDAQGQATHLLGAVTALPAPGPATEEPAAARADLLADMSHEIRTPLHAIMGLAQLLHKGLVAPEQGKYVEALLANAENLLSITNGVLAVAKRNGGTVSAEEKPFDVAATARQAVQSLAYTAETKGLTLQLQLPNEPLPTVVGAASSLTQVLVNLLGNAIKFTGAGHIEVSVRAGAREGQRLELTFCVADSGIGIRADKVEQVFLRFAQASEATARRYGGTGLGLAICKDLVERQGGRIWVESELNRGSRFYFTIPYSVSNEASPAPLAPATGLLQGLRVLLVEDNELNTLLATTLLESWQAATEVAADGEQALALAYAKPYDLILMDVQLPRLSGVEAAVRLRSHPGPNKATPIIALTADAGPENVNLFAAAGFSHWLEKPYAETDLYVAAAQYTGREQAAPVAGAAFGFGGLGKLATNLAFISKMQRLFIDTVPQQLAQLEAAVINQNWAAARPLVHTLKTTYGSLQIDEAMQQIKKIEEILKNNPTHTVLVNLLHFLRQTTAKTAAIFEQMLAS